jgi:predicted AAA+ superfamily ATPase
MIEFSDERSFSGVARILEKRLSQPAPGWIQLLVGPRQVGKTTLLLGIAERRPGRAVYATADAPEAALPNWREGIWQRAISLARNAASPVVLLLDEVQYIPDWSQWLKARFDEAKREHLPLHIVASGSSSLRLGAGSRETMAGRFERLVLSHWSARDLATLAGISPDEAARRLVSHGGYPGAVALWNEPARWQAYLRDAIVEPAIGRDLLTLEQVRKPALLRQIFAIAAGHPSEILSLDKIAGRLAEKGALETIAHYLDLLNEAFLVTALQKASRAEVRRRRSPSKLIVRDNGLLAVCGQTPPSPESDPERWGRWVENTCLARILNAGYTLHYWREEPWEADGVFIGPDNHHWLIEVKTGNYTGEDLRGLARASEKFPNYQPLVLCDRGQERVAQAAGFETMPWQDFVQ